MIKVIANNDEVTIKHAEGTAAILAAELCCIVDAVCTTWSENEESKEIVRKAMILSVADALKMAEETRGADLEDDENADF